MRSSRCSSGIGTGTWQSTTYAVSGFIGEFVKCAVGVGTAGMGLRQVQTVFFVGYRHGVYVAPHRVGQLLIVGGRE
jgi:hypothetical protein